MLRRKKRPGVYSRKDYFNFGNYTATLGNLTKTW